MFCETCGKELPGRVDVCPFCGADVSDEFEDEIMEVIGNTNLDSDNFVNMEEIETSNQD